MRGCAVNRVGYLAIMAETRICVMSDGRVTGDVGRELAENVTLRELHVLRLVRTIGRGLASAFRED
jgi:hypothetical protein